MPENNKIVIASGVRHTCPKCRYIQDTFFCFKRLWSGSKFMNRLKSVFKKLKLFLATSCFDTENWEESFIFVLNRVQGWRALGVSKALPLFPISMKIGQHKSKIWLFQYAELINPIQCIYEELGCNCMRWSAYCGEYRAKDDTFQMDCNLFWNSQATRVDKAYLSHLCGPDFKRLNTFDA